MLLPRSATVIVISDSIAAGSSTDQTGEALVQGLKELDFDCHPLKVVPDEIRAIRGAVGAAKSDLIITAGGTGVGPRDVTPEAVVPLIEKRLFGVEEAYRAYGMRKTPTAMLTRCVAGTMGFSLILSLPGSPAAAQDALDCLFPTLLHVFDVIEGARHT